MPNWSAEQNRALIAIDNWLKNDSAPQLFCLSGYAGTGKTTLAKAVAENCPGEVYFAAYTGKAAHVMRRKGCVGATTIHSLIYIVKEKSKLYLGTLEQQVANLWDKKKTLEASTSLPENVKTQAIKEVDGEIDTVHKEITAERKLLAYPSFSLNPESALRTAKLVIIDEGSMIDERMGQDILSFRKKVLVLGDPAQLPPVYGSGYFMKRQPDFMLEDIHRQALNSPIIQLATMVRNGKTLKPGKYGNCIVQEKNTPLQHNPKDYDQILVGRNATRKTTNRRVRELLKFSEWHPIPGDRVICLRNDHDVGLLNGAMYTVDDVGDVSDDKVIMTVKDDDNELITVECHSGIFKSVEIPWWDRKEAQEFDFGYGITVHKSQGSQWDNVLLYDESFCFREKKFNWLYTGITRAAERIVIMKT